MSTNDGGPAFPHDGQQNYTGGMTLRDYFAAKAMQGMLFMVAHGAHTPANSHDGCAKEAYALADAMLKAREGA